MTTSKKENTAPKVIASKLTASQQRGGFVTTDVPGYKFVWLLKQTMTERDVTIGEVVENTGVSQSTISHLMTGRRSAVRLEKESIAALSKWMGLPVLSGLILAEHVSPEDFYTDTSLLDANIDRAVRYILSDGDWGAYAPRSILTAENDTKLYLIWCYEQATKVKLLSGSVDFISLIEMMKKFRAEHPIQLVE